MEMSHIVHTSESKRKIDKKLVAIFSISVSIFVIVNIYFPELREAGSFYALIPILLLFFTPILVVHLCIKEHLFQYSNTDIFKNALLAYKISILIGMLGAIIISFIITGGDLTAFGNSFAGGWAIFIVATILFGTLLLCTVTAAGLFFWTIIYMNMVKKVKKRSKMKKGIHE